MTDDTRNLSALFQVYLRLRPAQAPNNLYPVLAPAERFLAVEQPEENGEQELPTHITLNPPNDNRRRAVEKFAFTKVFEEDSSQLDLFHGTGVVSLVEGVLGSSNNEGRDGLLATLGVTGSGKVQQLSDQILTSTDKDRATPSSDPRAKEDLHNWLWTSFSVLSHPTC